MPAYLTHRMAGEMVLEAVGVPDRRAFYLGCQGPDMLFFHNYQPWRRDKTLFALGVSMHAGRTRALLEHLIGFARDYAGADRDELVSYAAGFLTHYAVDKNAHPFVYRKTGEDDARHQALEYMWDSYTAVEHWGIEPSRYDIGPEIMYDVLGDGVCGWYSRAADELYGLHIGPQTVRQAQRQFAHAKQALGHVGPVRRFYLDLIGKVAGFDATSLLYPLKRDDSLFSAADYAGMKAAVDEGVRQAKEMLPAALRAMDGGLSPLPAWFGDLDFAGASEKSAG
jgi:hypothetical protein